jgi:hypothetical protein
MPSSYSTSLRFELQYTGENVNTWGARLDNTLARVDDAIAGYVAIALTGDYSLQSSNDNTSADEARRAFLKFTGTLAANATVTLPSVSKHYWIWNATNKVLTISLGAGNTVTIDAGDKAGVWSDGTNINHDAYFGGYGLKDYIAASVLAATGSLPSVTGNAGKVVYTDGATAYWKQIQSTDIGDFEAAVRQKALIYTLVFGS